MHKTGIMLFSLTLTACGKSAPTDTVQSLVANPERLKEVQRLCKEDPAKMGETCNAASQAFRQRFMGNGQPKYTSEAPAKN
jgi:hypothetical protein